MVVSPSEAKELTQHQKELVVDFEASIDDFLKENYISGPITYKIKAPINSPKVEAEIQKIYLMGGWKEIDFVSDTTKGEYGIVLTPEE